MKETKVKLVCQAYFRIGESKTLYKKNIKRRQLIKKMKHHVLKDEEIKLLFDKFSYPMVKACLTQDQKDKAIAISKILWLFLVKDVDTEENIYNALNEVIKKHEDTISFGALYYHKMKKSLTKKEINKLKEHYSDFRNFKELRAGLI